MTHRFTLAITPPTTTAQQQGTRLVPDRRPEGKRTKSGWLPVRYDPKKITQARRLLCTALLPHRPPRPLEGPISLEIRWCVPYPKSAPARLTADTWLTSPPDPDNAAKLLLDAMTDTGFWHDDAQVSHLRIERLRSRTPRIDLALAALTIEQPTLPGLQP